MIRSPVGKVFAILIWVVACGAASMKDLLERVGKFDSVLGAELFLGQVFADHAVEECSLFWGQVSQCLDVMGGVMVL
jgi:hypothetical protein